MSMKTRIIDKLRNEWPAKVICLVIAIFIYIFHQASLVEKKIFVVPLKIQNEGIVMPVGDVPSSVSVVVKAGENEIMSIQKNDITATINLNNIVKKGTYTVPVKIEISEKLLQFDILEIKLRQENIELDVEKVESKYVNIAPSIVGAAAHGYQVDSVLMTPSTALITGPESIVNSLNEIYTQRINVSNAETNFSTEVGFQNPSKFVSIGDSGPYKAEVSISQVQDEHTFEDVSVELLNIPDGLMVDGQVPKVSFTLFGKMIELEKFILLKNSVQANFSDIKEPGTYEIHLKYNIPSDIEIKNKSHDYISVKVVKKAESERQSDTSELSTKEQQES